MLSFDEYHAIKKHIVNVLVNGGGRTVLEASDFFNASFKVHEITLAGSWSNICYEHYLTAQKLNKQRRVIND